VIKTFKDRETEKIFLRRWSNKLPPDIQATAYRKLAMIHSAKDLLDLHSPPGNHLEKMKGDRAEQHSIRINNQWRICFEWREGDAYQVEILDYHK
jgi:proteic killer suppression protein